MALRLDVTLEDGSTRKMKVLIDTGAQVNLVKTGLVPMREARRPVSFETADGSPMNGGEELTRLQLRLYNRDGLADADRMMDLTDDFFNADIQYDLILSYPTLSEHRMGVLPHRNALIHEDEEGGGRLTRWGEKLTVQADSGDLKAGNEKPNKIQNVKLSTIARCHPCQEHHQHGCGGGHHTSDNHTPLNRTRKGCLGRATLTCPTWGRWCGPRSGGSVDALCECDPGQGVDDSSERDDLTLTYSEGKILQTPGATDSYRAGQVSTAGVATRSPKQFRGGDYDHEGSSGGASGRKFPCTQVTRKSTAQGAIANKKARSDSPVPVRPVYTVGRVALGPSGPRRIDSELESSASGNIQTRSFEHFAILEEVRKTIVEELGGEQPSIDAFASPKNNQFPRFWTPKDSAWDKDWHSEGLMWINAPFDQLGKIAQKIIDDHAKAIVIAPKWTHMPWWGELDRISKTRFEVPEGTQAYRDAVGRVQPARRWQTVAFLVDGALDVPELEEDEEDPFWYVDQRDEVHTDPSNPMVSYVRRKTRSEARRIHTVEHSQDSAPSDTRKYTELIQKRFGRTALAERLVRDPPIRGAHGLSEINLFLNHKPRIQRPFRLVGEREAALNELILEFQERGWIEPSVANWASPAFVVPKKDKGTWRVVVDYRWLNECTVPDAYPIPLIDDVLNRQGHNTIWTVLDMKNGFHQMPLKPEHRPATTMSIPGGGLWQWKVMPMGVRNGNSQFQRMMEEMLKDFPFADVYVDDVIIGSSAATRQEALENHYKHVCQVLEKFEEEKLVARLGKSSFFVPEVEFCGQILCGGKKRPSPGKLKAIQDWEMPKTLKELRGFLGVCNYYGQYVKDLSKTAADLQDLSCRVLKWTPEAQKSFEDTKKAMLDKLELFVMHPDRPFILNTDASDYAIGATLNQIDEDGSRTGTKGKMYPVAFFSRKLAGAQRNWSPREKECYAIVASLHKWSSWIGLQPVDVLTDHKSLENWYFELVDTPSGPSGRRGRWHEIYSKFDLHVQYLPGPNNPVGDAMSRWAYPACKAFQDTSMHGSTQAGDQVKEIERTEQAELAAERAQMVEEMKGEVPLRSKVQGVQTLRTAKEALIAPTDGTSEVQQLTGAEEVTGSNPGPHADGSPADISSTFCGCPDNCPPPPPPSNREFRKWRAPQILAAMAVTESELPVHERNWGKLYPKCQRFKGLHQEIQDAQKNSDLWPKGTRLHKDRLYQDGRLCVPSQIEEEFLIAEHERRHTMPNRLAKDIGRRTTIVNAYDKLVKVRRHCQTCQAVTPANWTPPGAMESFPVPDRPMASICSDIFSHQPAKRWDGVTVDKFVLFSCRHSGYLTGFTASGSGLTADRVAREWADRHLVDFGVPDVITSDNGPQYASCIWRTLHSLQGTRVAYGHAYRAQTNGHAEVTGKRLDDAIRKISTDLKRPWTDVISQAIIAYNDTPGPSGYTPYEVVFGRKRLNGGLPLPSDGTAADMEEFVESQSEIDLAVRKRIEQQNAIRKKEYDRSRTATAGFKAGDKCWVRRPKGGDKHKTLWLGPCRVRKVEGKNSYLVQVSESHSRSVHRDQMRPYYPPLQGKAWPLYYSASDRQAVDDEEPTYEVERLLQHRTRHGRLEFKVRWKGFGPRFDTWESSHTFLPHYNEPWATYVKEKGLEIDVGKHLGRK